MTHMLEIRWHGRGGHGLVSASNLLAEMAVKKGLYAQSIPIFGAERRGAPTRVFTRISDKPIRTRSSVKNPDIVIITDRHLLNIINPLEGLKKGGYVIINVDELTEAERSRLQDFKVIPVNAVEIALKADLKVGGIPLVNIPLLGVLVKLLDFIDIDVAEEVLKERWSGEILEKNIKALKYAVEVVEIA
ncbi:hypothetical protein DRN87_05230 [Candidatus Geothermarchaeota archaeon]|nr:MAG: hypothetical protein DRN87_05230 [Candidatus Geothermarchaeota archaeon]HEW93576.1 hypothetical protein [Thermoprotei archaeon]